MFRAAIFALVALALPAQAQTAPAPSRSPPPHEVWTGVIESQFVGNAYTWRLLPSGVYLEDGVSIANGQTIQQTLSGKWRREGQRLTLNQDGQTFSFDGVISGDEYAGAFYEDGHPASRFCAVRGPKPPTKPCGSARVS